MDTEAECMEADRKEMVNCKIIMERWVSVFDVWSHEDLFYIAHKPTVIASSFPLGLLFRLSLNQCCLHVIRAKRYQMQTRCVQTSENQWETMRIKELKLHRRSWSL